MYICICGYSVLLLLWWMFMRGDSWLSSSSTSRVVVESAVAKAERTAVMADSGFLKCLGWRQTGGCDSNGPREPKSDAGCKKPVPGGASGYCAVLDTRTNLASHVMRANCSSVRRDTHFTCAQALDLTVFAAQSEQVIVRYAREQKELSVNITFPPEVRNGIVIVMYPNLMVSVHALVRLLRSYNCTLSIELWFLESEMGYLYTVAEKPIPKSLMKDYGPVTLHAIGDSGVKGFNAKIQAITETQLTNVLFLDADNAPVRDPTYLFDTPEFHENGAIFWPDFWHPQHTIFNLHPESVIWEMLGMDFVDMFEQESAQLLINKHKSALALDMLQFYAFHRPNLFNAMKLVHGDKDLFRLAWLKTKSPFYMIPYPPAAAGREIRRQFCGMTMVQFDAKGEILFLHRNAKKLPGKPHTNKDKVWTHLQTFQWDLDHPKDEQRTPPSYDLVKAQFRTAIFGGGGRFFMTGMCYGDRLLQSKFYSVMTWDRLPFNHIEDDLLRYNDEATVLQKESANQ